MEVLTSVKMVRTGEGGAVRLKGLHIKMKLKLVVVGGGVLWILFSCIGV